MWLLKLRSASIKTPRFLSWVFVSSPLDSSWAAISFFPFCYQIELFLSCFYLTEESLTASSYSLALSTDRVSLRDQRNLVKDTSKSMSHLHRCSKKQFSCMSWPRGSMSRLNNSRPIIDPWGTPQGIGVNSDLFSSMLTTKLLPSRYDLNQLRTGADNPTQFSSLSRGILWSTASKAELRSISIEVSVQ